MKNRILLLFFLLAVFSSCNAQQKPETYPECVSRIKSVRDSLNREYLRLDAAGKDSIIKVARQFVFRSVTKDIFTYWYGTRWEFYGQTRVPRQGTIACGYFVTAVLSDAGFNIPRVAWAQQASEFFILKMSTDIRHFSNSPVSDVISYIRSRENGLYMVGLDCHVGFVYKNNDTIQFVHANYYQPSTGVMSENLDTWNPLNASKYRVFGRILDDACMRKWLGNERIE